MSKTRRFVSLAIALAAVVMASWWAAKTFWLTAPPTRSTQMNAYAKVEGGHCLGCPVVHVEEHYLGGTCIKGPVPVSMPMPPYTPLAKKNKIEGAVAALLDVDASGSVAGVKLTTVDLSSSASAGLEQGVIGAVSAWKFEPATGKGKPMPATVQVQVSFSFNSL
jgi:TonB family protein